MESQSMKKLNKPYTTLFLVCSVDGKISSGDTDELDVDRDWNRIEGVKNGIHQYYELEQQTDLFSLNSGKVMAKIGINQKSGTPDSIPVTFIIIDNKPHLNENGLRYLSKLTKRLILVSTNCNHPVFRLSVIPENIDPIKVSSPLNFKYLMTKLKTDFGVDRLTIHSGGELNSHFIRDGLIDRISIVIAPLIVGGKTTPSIVDGEALHTVKELSKLRVLTLSKCEQLENSYLHLEYDVQPDTIVT
jgi:2,5-diamino-6-(ribosylamino)-4(3H)-pyrimidinone 5'-phosphate reductase